MNQSNARQAQAFSNLAVVDLRAECSENLFGTEVVQPRLSWRVEAGGRSVFQTIYRIRAASSPEALGTSESLLWDSGPIKSGSCFDISYGGAPLHSMQRVWWDVEIQDNAGRFTRSAPTWMESGLLSATDWHADWLEAEDEKSAADRKAGLRWIWSDNPLDPRCHGFRIDFNAPTDLVHAEILVAGKDNLEGVWINGHLAEVPEVVYWGSLLAVVGALQPGHNSICISVRAETSGFFPVDGGAMAALIRLHRADGSIDRIVSSPEWRVMPEPPVGWHRSDFDASGWSHAQDSGSNAEGDPRPREPAMLLRSEFDAGSELVNARLYATALGTYEARINGKPVSDTVLAPEVSVAHSHVYYQVYDVGDLIEPGRNAIGFTVADGFYAGAFGWRMERYGFGPAPRRLLAQLRLDYADGSSHWVSTGPDWQIAESSITAADIYGGETRDARLEQTGWDSPGFDARSWRPAPINNQYTAKLVAQTSPPLRPIQVLRAVQISEPVSGRFVIDFGQNIAGWARIRAVGQAGDLITLRFAELLKPDGTVDQSNLRRAAAKDCFILRGEASGETFEPRFTYHGFRYLEVEGFPGTLTADGVEAIVVNSDCRETGTMDFATPLLAQIWRNTLWSQRGNFFAVPTDCTQRDERMGWMGDIQIFFDASAFNMEVDPFLRRFLHEARAAQRDDGAYPIVVPQPQSFPDVVTAGWSEAGIILPYGLWQRYGDTAVIEENWDAMECWMDFVGNDNPDFIWRNNRGLDLGDWLSVDAVRPDDETTPRILCATAYWALSAQMMAGMAEAVGRQEAASRYRSIHSQIRKAFADELVSPDGIAGNGSQTSQVLALYMDLVPDGLRAAAARVLVNEIAGRGLKLSTGFLGTPYLLDVLADAGEWDTVTGLLLQTEYPSWGYMPSVGATTIWERWNGDVGDISMNSYNHYALGAVIGFFYRRLAGIAPAAPGFRRISVRPVWLPAIGRVSAHYDSCVGTIATQIDGDAHGLASIKLTVPPNCIAEVELPAVFEWRESGKPVDSSVGIISVSGDGDLMHVEVGSGEYYFER